MTTFLESAIRVAVLVSMALAAAALLRRHSAAVRHWVLAVGLVCAMAMPALELLAPRWSVPTTKLPSLAGTIVTLAPTAEVRQPPAPATTATATIARRVLPSMGLVGSIWFLGVVVGLTLLSAGLARLTWIASRCEQVTDERWLVSARAVGDRLGLRRDIALLQSTHDNLLVTWGFWTSKVILPAGADAWSDARIRIVLCHELAHIHRADWVLQVMGGVLRAIYWFNPLVWLACHRLRHESERACDDDVLNLGMTGSEYASELLGIARTLRRPTWTPAPAMARASSLQRRIRAMLNSRIDRSPLHGSLRAIIAAGGLFIAVVVAGSGAAAQAVGSVFAGSFVDGLNNAIPNVAMTLKNDQTGEQYAVRSDADGRFAFDALPDGDYQGEVSATGFASTHPFFRIREGRSVQPNVIPLPLGAVEETITVTEDQSSSGRNEQSLSLDRLVAFRQKMQTMALAPPIKTRDVRPLFPPSRAGADATVFLEGIIDTNGYMKGLQVLQPADAEFARAAQDAVSDWQFEPTRLHGVPVDTSIRITVRFVR